MSAQMLSSRTARCAVRPATHGAASSTHSTVFARPAHLRFGKQRASTALGATAGPALAQTVTDATFKSLVIEASENQLVLVDFWAPWCGPCRMISSVIDDLAKEMDGKVKFLKMNTDECPQTAAECSIRSIPTVVIFSKGERKDAVIGAVNKSTLMATIEKYM